jgi:hypothetical protein
MGFKVKKVVTRGRPACIFCSAKNESNWPEWQEIQSRFLITSPNMISQKYLEGNILIAQQAGLPKSLQRHLIVSDEDVEIAKNFSQRPQLLISKNFIKRPENWLKLEIFELLKYPSKLNKFELYNEKNEQICICKFVKYHQKSIRFNGYFSRPVFCNSDKKIFSDIQYIGNFDGKVYEKLSIEPKIDNLVISDVAATYNNV